ncbi:hypothetical protein SAMN05192585_10595 [Acetanaerobacterium elongatum]|uniref:Uncharacterized protein n=1 Tax=Acetanaerobacterium elongatum TaxID=258515 RepID=A0A1G9WC67_9FIRM|nr:hypothetical protein SAMN05192585_10595 [Acetanaerobacterium elongatum]
MLFLVFYITKAVLTINYSKARRQNGDVFY